MFKFFTNKQVNRDDLPAFVFNGKPLLPITSALLAARGIDNAESARVFFDPGFDDLQDALLLKNIDAAADRIKAAILSGETILIYGDYDADGICAAAILFLYLKERGAQVIPYIPSRDDGYGLSVSAVERLAEEYNPDLWLTCDCGISNCAETGHIMDLGMDVIVTDHHDLPDDLPDCISVSPKLTQQGYAYPSLCGAGTAFMLVWALGGKEQAIRYIGLAAVATVGDMVPLDGENRIITQLGLKKINAKPPLWLKMLCESAGVAFPLSATDIAYKIVPRINAAGRMASAADAFEFITSDDLNVKTECLKKIEGAAAQRKAASDGLYAEAMADLRGERLYDAYGIVLAAPEWEKGITGILAAQLGNAFNRPVFIMSKGADNEYKGTARSIEGISARETLSAAAQYLTQFGGHAGAAGFSLPEKNIPFFKEAVLKALAGIADTDKELFAHKQDYDAEISESEITLELARQLKMFEPYGTGSRPPLFKLRLEKTTVTPMKNKPEHITVCTPSGVFLTGFNSHKLSGIFRSCVCKEVLTEIRTNAFLGKEELSVVIKHSSCPVLKGDISDERIAASLVDWAAFGLNFEAKAATNATNFVVYSEKDLEKLIEQGTKKPYGMLVIAHFFDAYEEFAAKYDPCGEKFLHEYLYPSSPNNYNRLIYAPSPDSFDFSFYDTVIFLYKPMLPEIAERICGSGAKVYIPGEKEKNPAYLAKFDLSRAAFGKYYRLFAAMEGMPAGFSALPPAEALYHIALKRDASITYRQFIVCLRVFEELRLIEFGADKPLKLRQGKAELTDSKLYCFIKNAQEGN